MRSRDYTIQCELNKESLFELLVSSFATSERPVQAGKLENKENGYYILQPEETMLLFDSIKINLENTYHLRVQPYNLPDPEDQNRMLNQFDEDWVNHIKQQHPDWKISKRY